jgi:hypothetical protein
MRKWRVDREGEKKRGGWGWGGEIVRFEVAKGGRETRSGNFGKGKTEEREAETRKARRPASNSD